MGVCRLVPKKISKNSPAVILLGYNTFFVEETEWRSISTSVQHNTAHFVFYNYICLSVRRFVSRRQNVPKMCTLFCLVRIIQR